MRYSLTRNGAGSHSNLMPAHRFHVLVQLVMAGPLILMLAACDRHEHDCSNDACTCPAGADCELSCKAPPCNITCESDSSCDATCANGVCSCEARASCDFACGAPPCHVRCAGDNTRCDGSCANGTCACGERSSCQFVCESGPCHNECPEGASCIVLCPNATAGTQNCDIVRCWAGAPVLCPGLSATTCNAECPPQPGTAKAN